MRNLTILLISLFSLSSPVFADSSDFQNGLNQAKAIAPELMKKSNGEIKGFDATKVFDHYSNNPDQTKYYKGQDQINTDTMQSDAVKSINQNDASNTVLSSMKDRPQYQIDTNSPDIQRSIFIQSDADNIIRGVSGRYIDCKPKQSCQSTYIEKSCIQSVLKNNQSCQKNLMVSAIQPSAITQTVIAHIKVNPIKWKNVGEVKIDLVNKSATPSKGSIQLFELNQALTMGLCPSTNLHFMNVKNNDQKHHVIVNVLQQPNCNNHFQLIVNIKSNSYFSRTMDVSVSYQYPQPQPPVITESWSSNCDYLEKLNAEGFCKIKVNDQCIKGSETKIINGISITRPCWSKQATYDCSMSASENTCGDIQGQGCSQTGSICDKKVGEYCLSYKQTYQCQQTQCVNTANVACGDGKDYCLNGDCTDTSYKKSSDFNKAIVSMSAVNEASKSIDFNAIFKGQAKECRDDAGNFSNCCQGSGWGQDINLAHCSEGEKVLGAARENKTAIYVGRYCSDKVLGICVEHKEAYCVFGSKIAKVIQEQGRNGQLHIGFGGAKHPNCNGISADQLSKINLSKIDFGHEVIEELSKQLKNPNLQNSQKIIAQHIEQFEKAGQHNE